MVYTNSSRMYVTHACKVIEIGKFNSEEISVASVISKAVTCQTHGYIQATCKVSVCTIRKS